MDDPRTALQLIRTDALRLAVQHAGLVTPRYSQEALLDLADKFYTWIRHGTWQPLPEKKRWSTAEGDPGIRLIPDIVTS